MINKTSKLTILKDYAKQVTATEKSQEENYLDTWYPADTSVLEGLEDFMKSVLICSNLNIRHRGFNGGGSNGSGTGGKGSAACV